MVLPVHASAMMVRKDPAPESEVFVTMVDGSPVVFSHPPLSIVPPTILAFPKRSMVVLLNVLFAVLTPGEHGTRL